MAIDPSKEALIMAGSFDGFFAINLAGDFTQANQVFCDQIGFTELELLSLNIVDLQKSSSPAKRDYYIQQIINKGNVRLEEQYLHKNKSTVSFEVGSFYSAKDQQVYCFARYDLDQAVTKELLRLSNALIEHANDIVIITDAEPREQPGGPPIVFVNNAFVRETGYSATEVIGKTCAILQGPNSSRAPLDEIREALDNWQPVQAEVLNYKKNGEEFWVELNITPVANEVGWFTHWISIERNITERKTAELALRDANKKSELLSKLKTEFIANMSHEIRTPMNGIIGLSTLAQNYPMSTEVRDYLAKIEASSNSLLRILNDILDFSKLDAGSVQVHVAPFGLKGLMSDIYSLVFPSITGKDLNLRINIDPRTPTTLMGDSLRIKQVLLNLIGNAIKFSSDGDITINITVLELQESVLRVRFEVNDSGPGFNLKVINKLQLAFQQGDGSPTRRYSGLGLGLAISDQLLTLMDSHLEIKNNSNHGACASFELTLKTPGETVLENAPSPESNTPSSTTTPLKNILQGKRILVAEDNRINQQVVKEFLKRAGAEVDTAINGIEVLELLTSNHYDAILMDVQMPEMDGLEATEQIREEVKYDSLPIIALSAGVSEEERDDCAEVGMNDFLPKPINPQHLLEMLATYLHVAPKDPP